MEYLPKVNKIKGKYIKIVIEIKYSITTQTYGLIQEWLVIKNEYSGQLLELGVRLFVDEDVLSPDMETVSITFNDIYLQAESLNHFLNKKRFSRLSRLFKQPNVFVFIFQCCS